MAKKRELIFKETWAVTRLELDAIDRLWISQSRILFDGKEESIAIDDIDKFIDILKEIKKKLRK